MNKKDPFDDRQRCTTCRNLRTAGATGADAMSATYASLAQLHRLNRAAARAGLVLRCCAAGGYLLTGIGWQAHSDDPAELLEALERFSRPSKRPIQDRRNFINFF